MVGVEGDTESTEVQTGARRRRAGYGMRTALTLGASPPPPRGVAIGAESSARGIAPRPSFGIPPSPSLGISAAGSSALIAPRPSFGIPPSPSLGISATGCAGGGLATGGGAGLELDGNPSFGIAIGADGDAAMDGGAAATGEGARAG